MSAMQKANRQPVLGTVASAPLLVHPSKRSSRRWTEKATLGQRERSYSLRTIGEWACFGLKHENAALISEILRYTVTRPTTPVVGVNNIGKNYLSHGGKK